MTNTGNLRDYYLNNKIDNLNGVSEIQRMEGLGEVNKEALKEDEPIYIPSGVYKVFIMSVSPPLLTLSILTV